MNFDWPFLTTLILVGLFYMAVGYLIGFRKGRKSERDHLTPIINELITYKKLKMKQETF